MVEIKANPLSTFLIETEEDLRSRTDTPKNPYKSMPSLSNLTWGLKPAEMMVVGARTSMGKTAWVLQVLADVIAVGRSVFYMSFEMKPKKIIERLFITTYGIDNISLLKGEFMRYYDEWEEFKEIVKKMRVVIGDGFGANWKELNSFLKGCEKKPDVVVVDYVQSIASTNRNSKEFLDEYIREFRQRLVEYDIAGVIVSQLNRTNPDSRDRSPQLHQLKGTGYLEEHCDICVLLDWLHKSSNSKDLEAYKIHVAKNRNGRTGYVDAKFTPHIYRFREVSEMDKAREGKQREDNRQAGWEE